MASKHTVLSLLISALLSITLASPVTAQTYGTYGNGEPTPGDLTINKQVRNPITGLFVENLGSSDATYSPNGEVLFRLIVKNASGETFDPVTVRDTFPAEMTFVSGPGTYDEGSNSLTFTLDKVVAGESRTVEILAKVKSSVSYGKSCFVNSAHVSASARPAGTDDTAQLCIQTDVLGATTLPVAGFNDLIAILPFAALGFGGIAFLRKRS